MANDGTVKIGVEFDENDFNKEAKKLGKESKHAEKEVSGLERGIQDFSKSASDGESAASGFSGKLSTLGKSAASALKTGVAAVGGVATGVVTGLLALESATEEYRVAQGKLNTAFEATGLGADAAKASYIGFYEILGDTDTATEASQLLATLAQNEQDIASWTNIAAGVYGTFGDALPIEGLIESANETAKVGQVTGNLADALNWAGISEDEFNERLAACTSESERNRLIMDTLAGTYSDAADSFYKNNEAVVEARKNQAELDEALAKVGESVAELKNAFMEQFGPVLADIATKVADFISGLDMDDAQASVEKFLNTFKALSPVIVGATAAFVAYKAAMGISGVVSALSVAFGVLTGATTAQTTATTAATGATTALNVALSANPIGVIIALVTGLVAALVTLWNTSEGFRDSVLGIFDAICSGIDWLLEKINDAIEGFKELFGISNSNVKGGKSYDGGNRLPAVRSAAVSSGGEINAESAGRAAAGVAEIQSALAQPSLFDSFAAAIPRAQEQVLAATNALVPAAVSLPVFHAGKTDWNDGGGRAARETIPNINIRFEGNLAELARILTPKIDFEHKRLGSELVN